MDRKTGVINAIALKNKMEALQEELEVVSRKIEMLEEEKRRAEKEDMEERIVIHMSSHHWTT